MDLKSFSEEGTWEREQEKLSMKVWPEIFLFSFTGCVLVLHNTINLKALEK